ncbi:lysophospholipid acyltransferase family protein [Roseimarinus sediminis]|uniref:lysophospholipid acyltransferase family protein n=1 Tax=Roseimarinus sediminis TaxID=1610899 RepID=UPI003D20E101
MKKSAAYYLLRLLTRPMQLFPLEFHYRISGLLYLLVYRLFQYRRNVVRSNLQNAFPEKSREHLLQIEKDFYHGFCDMFVETLYFTHLSYKKEAKRLKIENLELVNELLDSGKSIIAVTGHFGNWEFMQLFINQLSVDVYFVYKRLSNPAFDQFYRELRSRAAVPLEMRQTFRTLLKKAQNKEQFAAYFISDQRPVEKEIQHWLTFLNQDTPVMLGTERIAQKVDAAVVYVELSKIRRGYHSVHFELITTHAASSPKTEITQKFMQLLENSVKKHPDQYFWTHKRWKFQRNSNT